MTTAPAIRVAGIGKRFRRGDQDTEALAGVDLAIGAGEFVSIVGPSGCGKSTLLRIVAGLLGPSAGTVEVLGRPVAGPVTELGIVFQSPVLLDWRSLLDNVLAQIVRALIHDPALLLMDEPFGALDALTREQMRVDLEALWLARPKTVLFITHSIDEAVLLSDRVVVMSARPGRIDRVLEIGLARPRGLEARQHPDFDAAVDTITGIFLSRGVLRRGSILGTTP